MRILNEQRSTYGSPYVFYSVDVTPSNRQLNSIDLNIVVSTHLSGTGSLYGQGYVLFGYLYVEGNWYSIALKGQYETWRDTNVYTYSANYTISGLASSTTTLTNIKFKANETRVSDTAGLLTETTCSDIIIPSGHQLPSLSFAITEHNSVLTEDAHIADNVFVDNLSIKRATLSITTYDSATVTSKAVYNGNQAYTYTSIQEPNVIELDFTNNVMYKDASGTKVPIYATVTDSLGGTTRTDTQLYNLIPYINPIFNATTTVKRYGQTSGLVRLNIDASFYNDFIGDIQNNVVVKYKYWEDGTTEPADTNYITIPSTSYTISGNSLTISDYEIGSTTTSDPNYFDFEKKYNVKLLIQDEFKSYNITRSITKGIAIWSEYPDRVDFSKISVKNTIISPLKIDLVYQNTSSTSWQNGYLNIDVSNYDFLIIVSTLQSTIVPSAFDLYLTWNGWYSSVSKDVITQRHIYRSGNDIYWGDCYYRGINGHTGVDRANDIDYPVKIYGIKIIN